MKKDNVNQLEKEANFLGLLLLLMTIIFYANLFLQDVVNSYLYFAVLIPLGYFFYNRRVIRPFFANLVSQELNQMKKQSVCIDKMISDRVETSKSHIVGFTPAVYEYYFDFYNHEFETHYRVIAINCMPNYMDVDIAEWEGQKIDIFIPVAELKDQKRHVEISSKTRVVKIMNFKFDRYALDDCVDYSLSESLAIKHVYRANALILIPFFISVFAFYYMYQQFQ